MERFFTITNPLYWIFITIYYILLTFGKLFSWVKNETLEYYFLWFELPKKDIEFWETSVKNFSRYKKHFNKKLINRLCKRKSIKLIRKHYSI